MISIDSVIKVTETVCECSNSSASGFFDFAMDIALLVVGAVLSHVAVWLAARGKLKVYYSTSHCTEIGRYSYESRFKVAQKISPNARC